MNYFSDESMLPEAFSKEEIESYFKLHYAGDIESREVLISHNIRLVYYIVYQNFSNSIYDLGELISVGSIGLIKAVDTFKLDLNFSFSSYASRCIMNEILMFYRKENNNNLDSLDRPLTNEFFENITLGDTIEDEKADVVLDYEQKERVDMLRKAMDRVLSKKERSVLELKLSGPKVSDEKIAMQLGISRSYVNKLLHIAYRKLKNFLSGKLAIEDKDTPVEEVRYSFVDTSIASWYKEQKCREMPSPITVDDGDIPRSLKKKIN